MRAMILSILACLLAAMVASGVAGQTSQPSKVSVTIHDDESDENRRLHPEVEVWRLPVDVSVVSPPGSACVAETRLDFDVAGKPDYLSVIPDPPTVTLTRDAEEQVSTTSQVFTYEAVTNLTVSAFPSAPGFVDGWIELEVTATHGAASGGCNWDQGHGKATTTVKIDYVPGFSVALATVAAERVQPWEARIPVQIENEANAPTRVSGRVLAPPELQEVEIKWEPAAVLESKIKGTSAQYSAVFDMVLAAPGPDRPLPPGNHEVRVLLTAGFDGTATHPPGQVEQEVTFSLPAAPITEQVPSLASLPTICLLAALAWLVHRRRT